MPPATLDGVAKTEQALIFTLVKVVALVKWEARPRSLDGMVAVSVSPDPIQSRNVMSSCFYMS